MVNNFIQNSFHISAIIPKSWASELSKLSKRDTVIGVIALTALTILSLYWVYTRCVSLDDLDAKPLDKKDDLKDVKIADKIATPPLKVATPTQDVVTPHQKVATPPQKVATPPQKAATPPQKVATPTQDKKTATKDEPKAKDEPKKIEKEKVSASFEDIKDEIKLDFMLWQKNAAKAEPKKFSADSYDLIMTSFNSAKTQAEFFQEIDLLKNNVKITGQGAYDIKTQFKKLTGDLAKKNKADGKKTVVDQPLEKGILKWDTAPLVIADLGMKVAEQHAKFPDIDDALRYGTRDKTIEAMCTRFNTKPADFKEIGELLKDDLPGDLPDLLKEVKLFAPKYDSSRHMTRSTQLLGRFDVIAVPCKMDFDKEWQKNPDGQKRFTVYHGAAINIGESSHAEDYADYSLPDKSLNEKKYLCDTGIVFHQMLAAQDSDHVTEAVWFPFGMGAFLRNLPKNDPSYDDQRMSTLRQKIADRFAEEALQFPNLHIHMCLPLDDQAGSQTQQNYNAFVNAFSKHPELHDRVSFYINTDSTDLSQRLANQGKKVGFANGANRNLIGNHWFDGHARVAIDENFHRRSEEAASIALVLNDGVKNIKRESNEIATRIIALDGLVKGI